MRIKRVLASSGQRAVDGARGTSSINKEKDIKINNDNMFLRTIRFIREVSLTASMTLEASIAVPLFIFFFVNILSAINIIKIQSDLEAALHQTGSEISLLAYDYRAGKKVLGLEEGEGPVTSVGYMLYAADSVKKYLDGTLDDSNVSGGSSGLSFLGSSIMAGNDIVDITVDYKVKPTIPVIGFKEFPVEARYYGHAWTSYDISQGMGAADDEEEMVYVTEHGTVYHRNIGCKHLKLNVKSVSMEEISGKRNSDGSKYYACQYCGKSVAGGNVFITNYGNRYHSTVTCPGLKRKIYTIPISEVGGRGPCNACG